MRVVLVLALTIAIVLLLSQRSNSEPTQDKQALQSFISQVPHASRIQWNSSDSACNWVGVQCDPSRPHVHSLRLPAVGLVGPIPENTIGRLSKLQGKSITKVGKNITNAGSNRLLSNKNTPNKHCNVCSQSSTGSAKNEGCENLQCAVAPLWNRHRHMLGILGNGMELENLLAVNASSMELVLT